jgi:hypothetical protein
MAVAPAVLREAAERSGAAEVWVAEGFEVVAEAVGQ